MPSRPARMIPVIVMWWLAPLWVGSATAKPANSITTSEGIGMQALESAIRAKIPGRPASRTKCEVSLTTDSEIDASTSRVEHVSATIPGAIPSVRRRSDCTGGAPGSAAQPDAAPQGASVRRHACVDRPHQQPARARHATGGRDRCARTVTKCRVTARDFAQTLQLLDRFGIEHTAIGHHRGERLADKAAGLASRSIALLRWARARSGRGARPTGVSSPNQVVVASPVAVRRSTLLWATAQTT